MPRLRTFTLLCFGLLMLGAWLRAQDSLPSIVAEGVPAVPAALRVRMNQYLNMRVASFADWHPRDRAMLILTRFGDTAQVHLVKAPGGARQQLTFFPDRVVGAEFSPAAGKNYFLLSMDSGGGESFQIFRFDVADGSIRVLTDGKSRNENLQFNRAGTRAAYVSTRRNGRDYDLYIVDPEDPKSEKMTGQFAGRWAPLDWSPDGSRILLMEFISINETYLHVFDLATGKLEAITPKGGEKVAYSAGRWSQDGKGLYVVSDRGSEFQRLFSYDLGTRTFNSLTDHITWDVEEVEVSPDGRTLAFSVNADGIGELHLLDTRSRGERPVPRLPRGQVSNLKFHPSSGELAFNLNSAQSPSDVYSYNPKTGRVERWTFSETGGLNADTFQDTELVHYSTFDIANGKPRTLAAFVTKPPAKFNPPFPVVIDIHGGPEGQSRPGFQGRYNYFINELGIVLIEPNVRGSTGYGKSFTLLDNGYRREDTVKDIGALLDWVAAQPDLDSKRVAVMGGSYGGYMALASMTHFNDRLRCGIDIVGISNFVTFLESTKDYRRDLRRAEYGDERDAKMRDFLTRISPLTNAGKIGKPLYVAQGQNDPRVPVGESEQMVKKIRSNGGEVWYVLARDEGHGFAKKQNADYLYYTMAMFLEKYLLK